MKTEKQVRKHAEKLAYGHFHADNGEVWQPFENETENDLQGMQEDLADCFEQAMIWVMK